MSEKRTKAGRKQSGWWPYTKRVEVITAYIALGKSNLVEAVTGVPPGTVRQWKTQDWWRELEYQLRDEDNLELDAKLKKIVNKSLDAVLDRLENGDFFYDVKTGRIERMPAKLRDIAKVSAESIDRSVLLQKFSMKVEDTPKLDEHLKKLAAEFAAIIQGTASAVHDQRKEGLQEGASLGETGGPDAGQGPGSPEQGPVDAGVESGGPEGCGPQEGDLEGGDISPQEPGSPVSSPQSVVLT